MIINGRQQDLQAWLNEVDRTIFSEEYFGGAEAYRIGVQVEKYGALPSATAATNTTAIQTALDITGLVTLTKPGIYLVNPSLIIRSNTTLLRAPGVQFKQAPLAGAAGNILTNAAYTAAAANVTMSWTSGKLTASLGWAGHGKVVGDWVSVFSVTPSEFIGVFRVKSITDANNFIVQLWRYPSTTPTAVGGSVQAKSADVNFKVIGGEFDYDYVNNDPSGTNAEIRRHAVIFGHCHNIEADIVGKNARKFILCLGAIDDFRTRVQAYETNSDGTKVYGPARGGYCYTNGATGDDSSSVQTKETAAFAAYAWTYGDCLSVTMEAGCDPNNGGSPVSVYVSQNEYMDNIIVRTKSGIVTDTDTYAVRIMGDPAVGTSAGGNIGTIKIEDTIGAGVSFLILQDTTVRQLLIDKSSRYNRGISTSSHAITLTRTDIDYLDCGLSVNDTGWPSTTAAIVQCISGTLKFARISCHLRNAGSMEFLRVLSGFTLGKVVVDSCYSSAAHNNCVVINSGVLGTPFVSFVNNEILPICYLNASANANAYFAGNEITGATNGIVRTTGAVTCKIHSGGGNIVNSGSWLVIVSGTPVLSFFGDDISADVTLVARTAGSHFYNTNAAAGTLGAAGLVDCDSSGVANSWKLRTNDGLVY